MSSSCECPIAMDSWLLIAVIPFVPSSWDSILCHLTSSNGVCFGNCSQITEGSTKNSLGFRPRRGHTLVCTLFEPEKCAGRRGVGWDQCVAVGFTWLLRTWKILKDWRILLGRNIWGTWRIHWIFLWSSNSRLCEQRDPRMKPYHILYIHINWVGPSNHPSAIPKNDGESSAESIILWEHTMYGSSQFPIIAVRQLLAGMIS